MRQVPIACALVAFVSLSARAEDRDWLAHLPNCALEDAAYAGGVGVLYPRPGLPAVARPGTTLWLRVRLPVPLTPPPGVQRSRALRGWGAAIRGRADQVAAGSGWRYELRVIDVRPVAASTSIYRVALHVPAFAAEGTYDLDLRTPGAARATSRASLRVVTRSPRVHRLVIPEGFESSTEAPPATAPLDPELEAAIEAGLAPPPMAVSEAELQTEAFVAELARRDVDVYVSTRATLGERLGNRLLEEPTVPILLTDVIPATLFRLETDEGPRALTFGAPCDDPGLPFSRVVETLGLAPASTSFAPHPEAPTAPWRVVLPAGGHALEGEGRIRALRPASHVRAHGAAPSLCYLVESAGFPRFRPADDAPAECGLALVPTRAERGRLRAEIARGAQLAYAFGEDGTGWATESFARELDFQGAGPAEVHAWCLGASGASRWQTLVLGREVTGPVESGCAVCQIGSAAEARSPDLGGFWFLALTAWVLLRRSSRSPT